MGACSSDSGGNPVCRLLGGVPRSTACSAAGTSTPAPHSPSGGGGVRIMFSCGKRTDMSCATSVGRMSAGGGELRSSESLRARRDSGAWRCQLRARITYG